MTPWGCSEQSLVCGNSTGQMTQFLQQMNSSSQKSKHSPWWQSAVESIVKEDRIAFFATERNVFLSKWRVRDVI